MHKATRDVTATTLEQLNTSDKRRNDLKRHIIAQGKTTDWALHHIELDTVKSQKIK